MVNATLLRRFVPLAALNPSDLAEIARGARAGNYQPGQVIFGRGDSAATAIYLVRGTVELVSERGTTVVRGGTDLARQAISRSPRRAATATCTEPAEVVFIDREKLDLVLTWSQASAVEVVELGDGEGESDGDWMTGLLQGQAFQRIPPAHIAQVFAALRPVEARPGEEIVREGDPGDSYYIVTHGECEVLRRGADGGAQAVARLGAGRAFGEEALLSGEPRNATVRALSPARLMRLDGADFARLLRAPLLNEIAAEDVPADAILVDVRLPDEFRGGRLPDSINLPLAKLRERAAELDPARTYVVYCDSGRRSAAAAWLLCERGLDARLLTGGIPVDEMPVRG